MNILYMYIESWSVKINACERHMYDAIKNKCQRLFLKIYVAINIYLTYLDEKIYCQYYIVFI